MELLFRPTVGLRESDTFTEEDEKIVPNCFWRHIADLLNVELPAGAAEGGLPTSTIRKLDLSLSLNQKNHSSIIRS